MHPRHKSYAISFTIQELMVLKLALGFFRRTARRGLIWQHVCRIEPEIELKIAKLQKWEKKHGIPKS